MLGPDALRILRRLGVAFVVGDTAGQEPAPRRDVVLACLEVLLGDVAFLRRHPCLLAGALDRVAAPPAGQFPKQAHGARAYASRDTTASASTMDANTTMRSPIVMPVL